jgi:hypothetical protein
MPNKKPKFKDTGYGMHGQSAAKEIEPYKFERSPEYTELGYDAHVARVRGEHEADRAKSAPKVASKRRKF